MEITRIIYSYYTRQVKGRVTTPCVFHRACVAAEAASDLVRIRGEWRCNGGAQRLNERLQLRTRGALPGEHPLQARRRVLDHPP